MFEFLLFIAAVMLLDTGMESSSSAELEPEPDDPEPAPNDPEHPYKPIPGLSPLWMLPRSARKWRRSSFGSPRPWGDPAPSSRHKGVDIRAAEGDPVLAPTAGSVIGDTGWDGPNTRGVLFQSDGGPMLVFGAVAPGSYSRTFPYRLERGELIAKIGRYPKGDTMLHLEVYKAGITKRVKWPFDAPQPPQLSDPHNYLLATVST